MLFLDSFGIWNPKVNNLMYVINGGLFLVRIALFSLWGVGVFSPAPPHHTVSRSLWLGGLPSLYPGLTANIWCAEEGQSQRRVSSEGSFHLTPQRHSAWLCCVFTLCNSQYLRNYEQLYILGAHFCQSGEISIQAMSFSHVGRHLRTISHP